MYTCVCVGGGGMGGQTPKFNGVHVRVSTHAYTQQDNTWSQKDLRSCFTFTSKSLNLYLIDWRVL